MQLPCGCSVLFSWQHSFSFLGLWLYIKRFFSNEETLAEEPGRGEMWHSCLVFSLQVENGQEQGNDGKCLEHLGVFIKRLSGFCHSLTMSKQNCMTWSWEAPRYSSRTDPLISLSPLQRSDYGDWSGLVCCCWHTVLLCTPCLKKTKTNVLPFWVNTTWALWCGFSLSWWYVGV